MPPDSSALRDRLLDLADASAAGAPAWLAPIRSLARRRLEVLEVPTRRTERWKYTPVKALLQPFEVAPQPASAPDLEHPGARLINGRCVAARQCPGVEVVGFHAATPSQQALITELLDRRGHEHFAFADVNSALLSDGVFVHIHAAASNPTIRVDSSLCAASRSLAQGRILVLVDPGAHGTFIERSNASPGESAWHNTVTEIHLGEGAQLSHLRSAQEPSPVSLVAACDVRIGERGHYAHAQVATGGVLRRIDLTISHVGPSSRAEVDAVLAANNSDHLDLHLDVEHAGTGTSSTTRVNALADGRGRVVFNGRLHIHPRARGTDAHLHNRNLILASGAEIDTKPELEIYNDDVQCSHGASVGNIDADALFYLRSRGIDQAKAHRLLVAAFVDERLAAIDDPELRGEAHAHLTGYLWRDA